MGICAAHAQLSLTTFQRDIAEACGYADRPSNQAMVNLLQRSILPRPGADPLPIRHRRQMLAGTEYRPVHLPEIVCAGLAVAPHDVGSQVAGQIAD